MASSTTRAQKTDSSSLEGRSDDCGSVNGHRARLRERYRNNGIDALHPHEILELLLTYAIPRKDTKKIARNLLVRFKNVVDFSENC